MLLRFSKMHGAGNDFIVLNGIEQDLSSLQKEDWIRLADRKFGIGADQILLIERSILPQVDFRYRIINHDGTEVEQCGNGSRCFVRYVQDKGLTSKKKISVEVSHAILTLEDKGEGLVEVDMGCPIIDFEKIPFLPKNLTFKDNGDTTLFNLPILNSTLPISVVSMGNPHAVHFTDDLDLLDITQIGPMIENDLHFPNKVNAGFAQIINSHEIKLRVFERGSGETLSCGTGACAAVVQGIRLKKLQSPVIVNTRGGSLNISWDFKSLGIQAHVMMTGPAVTVFDGEINL